MPVVWRLVDPRYAEALDGEGNRLYGARWNSPGRGVVYASENLSLCVLENWVHLNPAMRRLKPPRSAVQIVFPEVASTLRLSSDDLPKTDLARWSREFGDRWLSESRQLILIAPSAIVPQESNVMFNPRHPQMSVVRIARIEDFVFDERLA